MNAGVALLHKALELGHQELAALAAGQVEKASELSAAREEAISMAWQHQGPVISQEYGGKLMELQQLQEYLTREGKRLKQQLAVALNKSQQEGRRLAGYRRAVGYAL